MTNGGRVLGVTAKGNDLKEARANAYEAVKWIDFDNASITAMTSEKPSMRRKSSKEEHNEVKL